MVRSSAGSPTCQSPVPADATTMRLSSPALAIRSLKTASAIGDRQILPVHTKHTLNVVESKSARSKVMIHCCAVSTPQQSKHRDWSFRLLPAASIGAENSRELGHRKAIDDNSHGCHGSDRTRVSSPTAAHDQRTAQL